jgi:prolyl-tRNA synthetase
MENAQVATAAENIYGELEAGGLEVLFDDRDESPGVKFSDADLLGIPVRITISPRTLEKSSVEVKKRQEKETQLIPQEGIAAKLKELITS